MIVEGWGRLLPGGRTRVMEVGGDQVVQEGEEGNRGCAIVKVRVGGWREWG